MTTMTIFVLVIEGLSLIALWAIVAAFHRLRLQRANLLNELDRKTQAIPGLHPASSPWSLLLWLYILSTMLITIVSLGLYVFQPHLL